MGYEVLQGSECSKVGGFGGIEGLQILKISNSAIALSSLNDIQSPSLQSSHPPCNQWTLILSATSATIGANTTSNPMTGANTASSPMAVVEQICGSDTTNVAKVYRKGNDIVKAIWDRS